jgi:glycine/D-amino acid oxidase-like deaminating enzyme
MKPATDPAPMRPLWAATAAAGPVFPELTSELRTEVAVIGAGYTGLSAALHLAELGRDVVVLEAVNVGQGASGLNGGQVIAGVKHDPDQLLARFGPQLGPKVIETVGSGPDLVFDLIGKHGIDCDSVRAGWIQPASSERELVPIRARVEQWRRWGADADLLDRAQAAALIGSTHYCGGWIDRRGGTVQPLSYVRGLARAATRAGARIHVRSPAIRLSQSGSDWRIDSPRGSVIASTVILASGAYTDHLVDPLRRSLVTVPSFQVATAPLAEPLRRDILPQGQSVSDTRRLLRYFRLDAGGRLLMGSRGAFDQTATPQSARHLYQAVREIYPQLEGIAFEYHWSGLVGITADRLPHLHAIAPGLLAGLGYNGRGIAMATTLGRLLARLAEGVAADEIGYPVTELQPLTLHRFGRLGARATMQYLKVRDRWDRRRQGLR